MLRGIAPLLLLITSLVGQDRVPPEFVYHRVWAIVPLIGTGKPGDPRRPMFTSPADKPGANQQGAKVAISDHSGIIGYSMQLSDDRKFALVEFVGATPADLKFIVNANVPGVKAFERGAATKAQVEAEFKKFKQNFKMDSIATRAQ
jgi:hypothetical protein